MAYRLKNLRVLLVDDNPSVCELIRSLLLDLGFATIDTAATPDEGWTLYCAHKPDILLVDWRIDHPEGLDFVRRIRGSRASPTPDVPVILMTAYTNKELLFQARDAGITEFLIKPFTIETLTRQLAHLIERPRDFVIAPRFVGPDRRRRNIADPDIAGKRKDDRDQQQNGAEG